MRGVFVIIVILLFIFPKFVLADEPKDNKDTSSKKEEVKNNKVKDIEKIIKEINSLELKISSIPKALEILKANPDLKVAEAVLKFLSHLDLTSFDVIRAFLKVAYYPDKAISEFAKKFILKMDPDFFITMRKLLKKGTVEEKRQIADILIKKGQTETSTFVELLQSKDKIDQEIAKEKLIELGPIVILNLTPLIDTIKDPILYKNVGEIWYRIGEQDISPLVLALKESLQKSRELLIDTLAKLGKTRIQMIIGVLRLNPTKKLKEAILEVIKRIGPNIIPEILPLASDPMPTIKNLVRKAIKSFGKKAVPYLIKILKTSKDIEQKRYTLIALANIGPAAAESLKVIKPLIEKENELQYEAVYALQKMGDVAKKVIPELKKAFNSSDSRVRAAAAYALANAGDSALSALPLLIERLNIEIDGDVKIAICKAIGSMGPKAKRAVPQLITALEDMDEMVVQAAAEALGNIGPAARSAIDPLIQVLSGYGSLEREAAAKALAKIGKSAIPKLSKTLRYSEDPAAREGAALAFKYMGKKARSAIYSLILALRLDIDVVKSAAALALGEIGPISSAAMRALVDASRDESEMVREAVAHALAKIGPPIIPRIINALRRFHDEEARITLIKALGNMGPAASYTLPTLLRYLQRWRGEDRKEIIKTLGKFGEKAKKAIPILIDILKRSGDPDIHKLIIESLIRFGKDSITYVVELLKEENPLAQKSAIKVLNKLSTLAMPYLIKIAKKSNDDYLVAHIIPILAKDINNLDVLFDLLRKNKSRIVQESLVKSLIKIGVPAIAKLIHIITTSNNIEECDTVRRVLASIGEPAVLPLVEVLRKTKKMLVKEIIIAILGDIGPKAQSAIVPLINLMIKWKGEDKVTVAKCLGKIGPSAIPYLVKLLEKKDKDLQKATIVALGETNSPQAIVYLLKSLKKPSLLSLVIDAIVKMKNLAVPVLIKYIFDKNDYIRFACAAALYEIKDPKALESLIIQSKKEKNPMIKYMIGLAIRSYQNHK